MSIFESRTPSTRFSRGKIAAPTTSGPAHQISFAALVDDLDCRGLLDDISVVVWGEFGRTPKINKNAGRDHWPQVASALLAGGGMRSGQVIGATSGSVTLTLVNVVLPVLVTVKV